MKNRNNFVEERHHEIQKNHSKIQAYRLLNTQIRLFELVLRIALLIMLSDILGWIIVTFLSIASVLFWLLHFYTPIERIERDNAVDYLVDRIFAERKKFDNQYFNYCHHCLSWDATSTQPTLFELCDRCKTELDKLSSIK